VESEERKTPGAAVRIGFPSPEGGGEGSEIGRLAWFCAPRRYAARLPFVSVISRSQSDFPVEMTTCGSKNMLILRCVKKL
jgi:hypothetical protein